MPVAVETDIILVRNTQPGPTVFVDIKAGLHIEWAGAGHAGGGHIQEVPQSLLAHPQFRKHVTMGILVVEESSPETSEAIARQASAHTAKRQAVADMVTKTLEPPKEDDYVVLPCIGPSSRSGGTCGAEVSVREKTKDDAPVLCPQHANLRPQFIPEPTDKLDGNGKAGVVWKLMKLEQRPNLPPNKRPTAAVVAGDPDKEKKS